MSYWSMKAGHLLLLLGLTSVTTTYQHKYLPFIASTPNVISYLTGNSNTFECLIGNGSKQEFVNL